MYCLTTVLEGAKRRSVNSLVSADEAYTQIGLFQASFPSSRTTSLSSADDYFAVYTSVPLSLSLQLVRSRVDDCALSCIQSSNRAAILHIELANQIGKILTFALLKSATRQ